MGRTFAGAVRALNRGRQHGLRHRSASSRRASGHQSPVHSDGFNRACQPSVLQRVLIPEIQPATRLHVNSVQAFEPSLSILEFNKDGPRHSVSVVIARS